MTTNIEFPDTPVLAPHEPVVAPPEQQETEHVNKHKNALDEIYAKRQTMLEKELETSKEIGFDQPKEPDPEPADEPKAPEEPKVSPETPEAPAEQQAVSKRTILVDGRPIEVTEDELIKLAQTGLSATQRYQQAAMLHQQAQHNTQPQQVEPVVQSFDDAKAKEIARRITYGSEEEQAKAIREIYEAAASNGGRGQTLPPEQLVGTITQAVTQQVKAEMQFNQNIETIGREFPEIFNSRRAMIAAADTVGELRTKYEALGIGKSAMDLYREACALTKDEFFKPVVTNETPVQSANVVSMTDKIERKRAAPQPPAAANKVATEAPKKVITGSDVVNNMRKARGQSVY